MNEATVTDVEVIDPAPRLQLSQAQIMNYMRWMERQQGALCRKKGYTKHAANPAGSKLQRKLARCGTLYGRLSQIAETFNDMAIQKFKDARA